MIFTVNSNNMLALHPSKHIHAFYGWKPVYTSRKSKISALFKINVTAVESGRQNDGVCSVRVSSADKGYAISVMTGRLVR